MTDSDGPQRKIGYRNPPQQHQFEPGQSGNPRGRPKGAKGLRAELLSAVNERVPVTIGGKRKKVTRLNFLIKSLVQKGMDEKTDVRVKLQLLQAFAQLLGVEDQSEPEAKALSDSDQRILDMLLNRLPSASDGTGNEPSSRDPEVDNDGDIAGDDGEDR